MGSTLDQAWGPVLKQAGEVKLDRYLGVLNLSPTQYHVLMWQNIRKMCEEYWSHSFKLVKKTPDGFNFTATGPAWIGGRSELAVIVTGDFHGDKIKVSLAVLTNGVKFTDIVTFYPAHTPQEIVQGIDKVAMKLVRQMK